MIAFAGCGLISSNATTYNLDLPAQTFSVDASGWQVQTAAINDYLAKACSPTSSLCAAAANAACPMNCTGSCDMAQQTCDLGLDIALHQTIDLLSEKPELKSIDGATTVLQVTVDSVDYEVTDNSLTVATPVLSVYVAPMSVMDPNDAMAKMIGTIDVVDAGTTIATRAMKFTDNGQATLSATLANFKNPFNIIVGGTLLLAHGDEVPRGKLDASVHVRAHASP
ncbi:MAG TPA: hypothetical protein VFQ65_20245 [Kofleriaceae bacterium]|nr:hypothetical protein [Kofleriaceae bacterium]